MIGAIFDFFVAFVRKIFHFWFTTIPVFVYNYIYATVLTIASYKTMMNMIEKKGNKIKSLLDVGVGPGGPLNSIIDRIPTDCQVLGIDIDYNYIPAAQKIFAKHENVTIVEKNFYDVAKMTDKFDVIVFSSSFMLMPDRLKALNIAKEHLNKGGNIYFLLTLHTKRSKFNDLLEVGKPYLKFITTVDFGKITYEQEFLKMMEDNGCKVTQKERLTSKYNPCLNMINFWVVETQVSA